MANQHHTTSTPSPDGKKFVFYHYDPSLVAAALFAALFGLLGLAHIFRVVRGKIWYFFVFTIGIWLQFGGYIGRIISSQQAPDFQRDPYIIQTLFLLVSPAFFAASIYMTLGRIIRAAHAESLSLITTRWLTKIFVSGDVISFFMQGAGGGLMASAGNMELGQWVIVGGLTVQLVYFAVFVVVAAVFHVRVAKTNLLNKDLTFQLMVLYITSGLILVRSVFRVVEFAQGNSGYIISHEAFLYVFDALLMFVVVVLYVLFPPLFYAEEKRAGFDEIPMRHKLSAGSDIESSPRAS